MKIAGMNGVYSTLFFCKKVGVLKVLILYLVFIHYVLAS